MIEVENLSKRFGSLIAVDDVSFSVERGEVLGLLGPNGAGKSTTMKMITGFIRPDAGTARVCGYDVVEDPVAAKRSFGYLPEGAPLWPDMPVRGFLEFIARIRGSDRKQAVQRIGAAVEKTQLQDVLEQPIDTLSKGFKRRVGLAQALLHDPEVLVLDEPTDGLDPNQKHDVRQLIQAMGDDKAIIISTHILEEVEAICRRAAIISQGCIVADSTPEDLIRRSARHNGVMLRTRDVLAARTALEGVGTLASIELTSGNWIFARPRDGASILESVTAALQQGGVTVDEITVERGRLDEVFRDITGAESHDA